MANSIFDDPEDTDEANRESYESGLVFKVPICATCIHRHNDGFTCDAFPVAIPLGVFLGKLDHTKPLPGDRGIQYQKK